jgi:hypothetical protein
VIDAAAAPQPPARADRVWRMVAVVVAAQAVIIAAGLLLFTVLGLANDGVGSCGGG